METITSTGVPAVSAGTATASRVKTLAVILVLTVLPSLFLGLLWSGPEEAQELYKYAEIAPDRDLWWGMLMSVGVLIAISVPIQALLVALLVTARGSTWATVGGVLMAFGAVFQAAGLGGWAATYFFATDPDAGRSAGTAVIEAANADEAHLVGLVPIGMALVVLGTILQSVGLFRSKVLPIWVPIATLSVILMFIVPGFGPMSLIGSVPMAFAAVSIAYFAARARRTTATDAPMASGLVD